MSSNYDKSRYCWTPKLCPVDHGLPARNQVPPATTLGFQRVICATTFACMCLATRMAPPQIQRWRDVNALPRWSVGDSTSGIAAWPIYCKTPYLDSIRECWGEVYCRNSGYSGWSKHPKLLPIWGNLWWMAGTQHTHTHTSTWCPVEGWPGFEPATSGWATRRCTTVPMLWHPRRFREF